MASKQENYLRMHHPSIFKKMKKGGKVENYAKGGKVKHYAQGGRNTDTVPAMLTPGEVVLNADQQEKLGNVMAGGGKVGGGQAKAAALFKHIGVPGFKEGGISGVGRLDIGEVEERWSSKRVDVEGGRKNFPITGIVAPKEKRLKTAIVPSNPPLFPHYGAENKKDALAKYYGGGKVKKKKRGY